MRSAAPLAGALLALLVAACGSSAPEETAPPPTPLPELNEPTFTLEPTESPDAPLRPTFDADAAAAQLLASVPEAIAPRCDRVPPGNGAMAEVRCSPGNGATTVDYQLYDAPELMAAAYDRLVGGLPAAELEGPGCGKGPGQARLPNGRKACFKQRGDATVAWTNDLVYVLAVAERADTDWAALERFWSGAGPVTP